MIFKTHTGVIHSQTDKIFQEALKKVASELRESAIAIRKEDAYAPHVTEEQKKEYHEKRMKYADEVENGTAPYTFFLWQRINQELTGECVALLN